MLNIRRISGDQSGVATIELAFIIPLLLLLFAGGVELARYVKANQQIDNASEVITGFVSRMREPANVNTGQLTANAFTKLVEPYKVPNEAGYIISGIALDPETAQPTIEWQRMGGKGGISSALGPMGTTPSLDPALADQLEPGDQVIATEVFVEYSNILGGNGSIFGSSIDNLDGNELYEISFAVQRGPALEGGQGQLQPIPDLGPCCGDGCWNKDFSGAGAGSNNLNSLDENGRLHWCQCIETFRTALCATKNFLANGDGEPVDLEGNLIPNGGAVVHISGNANASIGGMLSDDDKAKWNAVRTLRLMNKENYRFSNGNSGRRCEVVAINCGDGTTFGSGSGTGDSECTGDDCP